MKNDNYSKPHISVCIPCYNASKFLDKLFARLNSQTFKSYKIILIDDGSTDDTYDRIVKLKDICNVEVVVKKQKNCGISGTRNKLLDLVDTEYLFFLDPDDEIPPNALEILYQASENGKFDIITGKSKFAFNDHLAFPLIPSNRYKKNITSCQYGKSILFSAWSSLYKTKLFDGLRFLENRVFEDLGLLNYIFLKTTNTSRIKNIVYFYNRRKNKTSLLTFIKINRWKFIDIFEQTKYVLAFYEKENWLSDNNYAHYINDTILQIIFVTFGLSKHFSNNRKIAILPIWQIIDCINKFGPIPKFWKLLSYIHPNYCTRYYHITKLIKNKSKDIGKIALKSSDFFNEVPLHLLKQKIYFLRPEFAENMELITKNNPNSTFFVDEKYRKEFSTEYLNICFGVNWSDYNNKNVNIQYIDAQYLGLIDTKTFEQFRKLPKSTIILLDKCNASIYGINQYLNFVCL